MERKTEFWWASIGGAEPEPVEKTEHEGRPCVYTLGCADPFYLDDPDCPVTLASTNRPSGWRSLCFDVKNRLPMERPKLPNKDEAQSIDDMFHRRMPPRSHGWRGPR